VSEDDLNSCKTLLLNKNMTLFKEKVPANIRASSRGNTEGASIIQND
jgi:hypothetical protein